MILSSSLLALAALGGAQDPETAPDETWISLTGNVVSSSVQDFTLEYGEGLIRVEMDDWDWYDEAQRIVPGERVTVYGRIDDGLYEQRSIEADSVYVFERNTFFYANDVDEEGDYTAFPHFVYGYGRTLPDGSWMTISGTVQAVDGREFTLDNGFRKVVVDTDEMAYNPLDDLGFQKVDEGDRVSVTGTLDNDFFEKDELKAETIVSLTRDRTKTSKTKPDAEATAKPKRGDTEQEKQKERSSSSFEGR